MHFNIEGQPPSREDIQAEISRLKEIYQLDRANYAQVMQLTMLFYVSVAIASCYAASVRGLYWPICAFIATVLGALLGTLIVRDAKDYTRIERVIGAYLGLFNGVMLFVLWFYLGIFRHINFNSPLGVYVFVLGLTASGSSIGMNCVSLLIKKEKTRGMIDELSDIHPSYAENILSLCLKNRTVLAYQHAIVGLGRFILKAEADAMGQWVAQQELLKRTRDYDKSELSREKTNVMQQWAMVRLQTPVKPDLMPET